MHKALTQINARAGMPCIMSAVAHDYLTETLGWTITNGGIS